MLAFSATENNDKVGCIFFSDRVEKFIPPKKGRAHILMIIRELIEFTPQATGTDVGEALHYLTNVLKNVQQLSSCPTLWIVMVWSGCVLKTL